MATKTEGTDGGTAKATKTEDTVCCYIIIYFGLIVNKTWTGYTSLIYVFYRRCVVYVVEMLPRSFTRQQGMIVI